MLLRRIGGGSPRLKGKVVSVNAPNDVGTLLIDSLLVSHGLTPRQVHF
jgi:ABC-type nitrate/sulfonate/bicarbonate transport system substrate-binding protein